LLVFLKCYHLLITKVKVKTMKRISVLLFIATYFFATSCGKEDEVGFTSLIGSWTYTTPDEKITVSFDIVGGDSELLKVTNQLIVVEGKEGRAEVQTEGITESNIGRIRINANDAELVKPYDIIFSNVSASDDFTVMNVEEVTYIFPWPQSNVLNNVQIKRK